MSSEATRDAERGGRRLHSRHAGSGSHQLRSLGDRLSIDARASRGGRWQPRPRDYQSPRREADADALGSPEYTENVSLPPGVVLPLDDGGGLPPRQPRGADTPTAKASAAGLSANAGRGCSNAAGLPRSPRAMGHLGICAGLRNQELRGLQGRHFGRPGSVLVSCDIAKGGRERWVPVLPELEPIVAEIREHLEDDDYVLPAQRWRDPGSNLTKADRAKHPSSAQALNHLVKRVAARAGISGNVHPHTLRHAFGDYVARASGDIRTAQFLMGHATVSTTEAYLGEPTLDELTDSVKGLRFAKTVERMFSPVAKALTNPVEATTGIEPV